MSRVLIQLFILASLSTPAAAQQQVWIRQFGTTAFDGTDALCRDGADGAFVAGNTRGNLGGANAGFRDVWLARYDSTGGRAWVRQFGTSSADDARALCPDGVNGLFLAGVTDGSLGGPSAGLRDVWLSRYSDGGDRIWIRQFGTSSEDFAWALCPDQVGGAFFAGETIGSLGASNAGMVDAWLARYDDAGNRIWVRQFGTSLSDGARALCIDGAGGSFVAGFTNGDLGGTNAGPWDAWLARYDAAGNRLWIRQFGTSGGDVAYALCPDSAGGVFIAGFTEGGLGGSNSGARDCWLARYNSNGARIWIRQFGTSLDDYTWALCTDGTGGAFVAGDTYGDLGGPNTGNLDAWLARYDDAGDQVWIQQLGTSVEDYSWALCPDGTDGAFITGRTLGTLGAASAGSADAWLARYRGAPCSADFNSDGQIDFFDYLDFVQAFSDEDPAADFNGDAQVDFFDYLDFAVAFDAGCE